MVEQAKYPGKPREYHFANLEGNSQIVFQNPKWVNLCEIKGKDEFSDFEMSKRSFRGTLQSCTQAKSAK